MVQSTMTPARPERAASGLSDRIAELLPKGSAVATILDIRPGLWTFQGCSYPSRDVGVVAFDPLAGRPCEPAAEDTSTPGSGGPVLYGEQRIRDFASEAFDLVVARDWVDQCLDAERAIREMVRIARSGGYVLLEHRLMGTQRQDARSSRWAFSMNHAQELLLHGPPGETNVRRSLATIGRVQCTLIHEDGTAWLTARISKQEGNSARTCP